MTDVETLVWEGQEEPSLDEVQLRAVGPVTLGVFGGCRASGATKNEDAVVVWVDAQAGWVFAAVLDAHGSSESARAVVAFLKDCRPALTQALNQPVAEAFAELEQELLAALTSPGFRAVCRNVQGETALLCCATKGGFLWWFSVGDCVAYLLHPELTRLGQFALNQRQFFEWVGRVNTFDDALPAYSRGVRALRAGRQEVVLLTDGVLEFGARPFESPRRLGALFQGSEACADPVQALLREVQAGGGRDGATVVHWTVEFDCPVPQPSA